MATCEVLIFRMRRRGPERNLECSKDRPVRKRFHLIVTGKLRRRRVGPIVSLWDEVSEEFHESFLFPDFSLLKHIDRSVDCTKGRSDCCSDPYLGSAC